MKIYYAPNTRAVRIVWLFEELGLPYDRSVSSWAMRRCARRTIPRCIPWAVCHIRGRRRDRLRIRGDRAICAASTVTVASFLVSSRLPDLSAMASLCRRHICRRSTPSWSRPFC